MTYSRTHRPADRVAMLIAVGAVHAAAFYAVITGLSVAFVRPEEPPQLRATNSPLPPEPPSPPSPRARQTTEPLIIRPIPTPLATPIEQPTITVIREPWTPGTGAATGSGSGPIDPPPPRPSLVTPRAPKPLGRPGDWVTEADYPTNSIRLGHAGVVGFALAVSAAGRATGCEVTRSSGFAELDALTCTLMLRRSRFQPATDEQGAVTAGRYASAVRWQIPN